MNGGKKEDFSENMSALLKECLAELGDKAVVLYGEQDELMCDLLTKTFPFVSASIDWDKVKHIDLTSIQEVIPALTKLFNRAFDKTVYVIWNDADLPILKMNLETAIEFFDVLKISSKIFLFNPTDRYAVQWHDLLTKAVGVMPK